MFDVAIIGTGPAGVSAALTLQALKKRVIWFGTKQLSQKIRAAEQIRNYPGLPGVSGMEMQQVFSRQIEEMEIPITQRNVTGVYHMGSHYAILCDQEQYEARAVIVATGVESVKPIPGELEYVGRGVSYCATCDGFLYKDKTIAVVCTTKDLEHEIEYLAGLARKVYLFPLYKHVQVAAGNVEQTVKMPTAITGGMKVQQLHIGDTSLDVDGVFMLKQAVAPSVLVPGLEAAQGHILVDRSCRTNLPGCFAAGDCTGRPYQYAKAVGEGNVAAHSAVSYLAEADKP